MAKRTRVAVGVATLAVCGSAVTAGASPWNSPEMGGALIWGGVFVGGASRRMGQPKGLLRGPDGRRLIDRARDILRDAGVEPVLVGSRPAYRSEGAFVPDAVANAGPLGGLVGLLEHAGGGRVVTFACDMPFVTAEDVRRLLSVPAPIAAPWRDGRWEPLCAAYLGSVLPSADRRLRSGKLSMQGLLHSIGASRVDIEAAHLVDWDTPEDASAS